MAAHPSRPAGQCRPSAQVSTKTGALQQLGSRPLMNSHAFTPGPAHGCPYIAVGMQRALASLIGLPSSSASASWMLLFLMPADVRRSFMRPPGVVTAGERFLGSLRIRTAVETGGPPKTHRFRPDPASLLQGTPEHWAQPSSQSPGPLAVRSFGGHGDEFFSRDPSLRVKATAKRRRARCGAYGWISFPRIVGRSGPTV